MNVESCRLNTREMEKLQKYCRSRKTMQALGKAEEEAELAGAAEGKEHL